MNDHIAHEATIGRLETDFEVSVDRFNLNDRLDYEGTKNQSLLHMKTMCKTT